MWYAWLLPLVARIWPFSLLIEPLPSIADSATEHLHVHWISGFPDLPQSKVTIARWQSQALMSRYRSTQVVGALCRQGVRHNVYRIAPRVHLIGCMEIFSQFCESPSASRTLNSGHARSPTTQRPIWAFYILCQRCAKCPSVTYNIAECRALGWHNIWYLFLCDEQHLVFECPALASLRHQYTCLFRPGTVTMQTFLWQKDIVLVAKFVFEAMAILTGNLWSCMLGNCLGYSLLNFARAT